MAVFRELRGVNITFLFSNPEKAHPCAEPCRLTYYAGIRVKIGSGALAVERWKNPPKRSRVNIFDVQFRAYVEKKPLEGS